MSDHAAGEYLLRERSLASSPSQAIHDFARACLFDELSEEEHREEEEEEEELSEEEHREEGIAIVDGVERRCTIEKLDVEGSEGLSQNSCQHRVFYGG